MRKLQEIFNLMVDSQIYARHTYMCHALVHSYNKGIITLGEYLKATRAIDTYLNPTGRLSLRGALDYSNRPKSREYMTTIYKDWSKRPRLLKEEI